MCTLFAVNAVALVAWEACIARGVASLSVRWAPRVIAVSAGAAITALALWSIFADRGAPRWYVLLYVLWLAATFWAYRLRSIDLFILAGAVLSLVVVISSGLARGLLDHGDAGAFLFIGLVIIAGGGMGAYWLRNIAGEERK